MLFLEVLQGWPITLIVAVILCLLWFIRRLSQKNKSVLPEIQVQTEAQPEPGVNDEEIVAAITAAITAYYQTIPENYKQSKLSFKIKKKE